MGKWYRCYQPNRKDIKDRYGDCQIRALTKVLGVTWLEAYDMTVPLCREYQLQSIFNAPIDVLKTVFERFGFEYHGISNKKGAKRPTVNQFAGSHPKGAYICNVANHEVAVVDGHYYDTWDCGDYFLYGYFERK